MNVNDPKFALRIFADPKIEGRIAMGLAGTVRDGPIVWLIHDKQIGIARPHHFSLSAGRPFPDGPLIGVMLRRSLNIRCIKYTSSVEIDLLRKVPPLHC